MSSSLLPVSARPETTLLPRDSSIPLTTEQTAALWGGDLAGGLRMLVRAVMENRARQPLQPTPAASPALEKAARNA